MSKANAGGVRLVPLLVVLLALGGAAGWNYHRNLQLENAEPRPYRGLAEEQLVDLAAALEAELDAYTKRYEAVTGRKVEVRDAPLLAEQVVEFERVQGISRGTRELGERLSQTQGSLRRVEQEQRRRGAERDRMRVHLRRLLSFG